MLSVPEVGGLPSLSVKFMLKSEMSFELFVLYNFCKNNRITHIQPGSCPTSGLANQNTTGTTRSCDQIILLFGRGGSNGRGSKTNISFLEIDTAKYYIRNFI